MAETNETNPEEEKPLKLCGFFRLDVPRDEEEEYIRTTGNKYKVDTHRFITRRETQGFLVILLLLDVVILFIELFLDTLYPLCSNIEAVGFCDLLNTSDSLSCSAPDLLFECIEEPPIVYKVETGLYYASIAILFTFNIESLILFYSLGFKEFVRNLGNVFDVIVITTSIVLEIWLHESDEANAGAIIVAARLWRFLRIGHGITYASKRRAGAKQVLEELPDVKEEKEPYWTDPVFSYFRLSHDEDFIHNLIETLRAERNLLMHRIAVLLHKSPRFQIFLVFLLLLDVLTLFASIFLDAEFPACTIVRLESTCTLENAFNFSSPGECFVPTFEIECVKDPTPLKLAKNILYFTSVTILAIFELEVLARMLVFGFIEFFRSLGNIFDFVIITASLVLEVVYHELDDSSAGGLLIIARIWRFIRISHGILFAGGGARREQAKRLIRLGAEAIYDPKLEDDEDSDEDPPKGKGLPKLKNEPGGNMENLL